MKKTISTLLLAFVTTASYAGPEGGIFSTAGPSPQNGSPWIYFHNDSSREILITVDYKPFGATLNPFSYFHSKETINYHLSGNEAHLGHASDFTPNASSFAILDKAVPAESDQGSASQYGHLYSNHAAAPEDVIHFYSDADDEINQADFTMNKDGSPKSEEFPKAGIKIQAIWKNNGDKSGWLFVITDIETAKERMENRTAETTRERYSGRSSSGSEGSIRDDRKVDWSEDAW